MSFAHYPFSAVVGQTRLKRALIVNAIDPSVGGVLVLGPRGTGKSTLVRGLTDVLPDQRFVRGCPFRCPPSGEQFECPFCEAMEDREIDQAPPRMADLPLGASVDQLLGSLNLEKAVREGKRRFQPGLLARANRGILYVDEVNLLPDRLVDLILDAAASGVNRVERDGVSFHHPARFILVGTMNPEEGMLRPQLTDRFGLGVASETLSDPEQRMELARRAEQFDRDPDAFRRDWRDRERTLRKRIAGARQRRDAVSIQEEQQRRIARVMLERQVEGHRADVVVRKTAKALAAWNERRNVQQEDVDEALEMALLHRGPDSPDPPSDPGGEGRGDASNDEATDGRADRNVPDHREQRGDDVVVPPESFEAPPSSRRRKPPTGGRRLSRQTETSEPGRETLPRPHRPVGGRRTGDRLDVGRTLLRRTRRVLDGGEGSLRWDDLRFRPRSGAPGTLRVCVLDTSASMAKGVRIGRLKGDLMRRCHRRRAGDRVALLEFRGSGGRLLLPPTSRPGRIRRILDRLPVGGSTPAREGIRFCRRWLQALRIRPRPDVVINVCSDGRFPLSDVLCEELRCLAELGELRLVDTDGPGSWGSMEALARRVECDYRVLPNRVA